MVDPDDFPEVLLPKARKVNPQNAEEIARTILSSQTRERIEVCTSGTDEEAIRSLIDEAKRSMKSKSRAHSPGPVQKPAQQLQSLSKPGPECSNAMQYPHSSCSSGPWTMPCQYRYTGSCTGNVCCPCWSSHGFGSFGILEMEIRELLILTRPSPVLVVNLPRIYFERYKKLLQVESNDLPSLLLRHHTIMMFPDSWDRHCVVLLEDAPVYFANNSIVMDDESGADQIYITFSATSTFTRVHVCNYFSHYGTVTDVQIPIVNDRCMFGFVRFLYPQTVKLLLSEWNPLVPHLICGARVFVKRYKPKAERIPKEGDNVTQLSHASDGPEGDTAPQHIGENKEKLPVVPASAARDHQIGENEEELLTVPVASVQDHQTGENEKGFPRLPALPAVPDHQIGEKEEKLPRVPAASLPDHQTGENEEEFPRLPAPLAVPDHQIDDDVRKLPEDERVFYKP